MSCENCIGFCQRRQTMMPNRHVELCSSRTKYADAFDRMHGVADESIIPGSYETSPGSGVKMKIDKTRRPSPEAQKRMLAKRRELGDVIESALTALGFTKERVENWVGAPCGCEERKKKLNKLSRWAREALKTSTPVTMLSKLENMISSGKPTQLD